MKTEWTKDMIDKLKELRAGGLPLYLCAERIGVGYSTACRKAHELGLASRKNHGQIPGYRIPKKWLDRYAG